MTNLYYTSRPAAEYMSSEFGIAFSEVTYEDGMPRYCVMPESLPLFKVKKGDMIMLCNGMEAYRYSTAAELTDGEKIIMRDQKPFIMPEIDAREF